MNQFYNVSQGDPQPQKILLPAPYRLLIAASFLISLAGLSWCAFLQSRAPRVAFVRSGVIVEKYLGMQEARSRYQHKLEEWQSEVDTLQGHLQTSLARYNQEATRLSKAELQNRQLLLESQQQALAKHQAVLAEKAQAEEAKLLEGTLGQINQYVETYANDHGYTVVLGTTQTGSLLYGSDAVDITTQVLQGLNQSYK